MIKFFRKIRQNLLADGKTGKYFKYAIGEIILVVIGILIALQINNWNGQRLQNKIESKYLSGLNKEFKNNAIYLIESKEFTTIAIETGKKLMSLVASDPEVIKQENIDSLLFYTFEYGSIDVSENSIVEILQAGQLQNFKNDTLKTLILDWTQIKTRAQSIREALEGKSDALVNYLTKHYPLKDIDAYGVLGWKSSSKITIDKYAIFNDMEFENILDDLLYNVANYYTYKSKLLETVERIIEESEIEP